MEYKDPAKSIPKGAPFKIPIKAFEPEINNESAKGKQKEILELLTNHNEISSYQEYQKIEKMMQRACSQGDLELLEIYLNEEVKFETEKELITFKINKKTKTASLFRVFTSNNKLIIPRTIKYETEDYLITSVISSGERSKNVKNIEFSKDSEVRIFYEESFCFSNIKSISFPASLIELKEGWCCQTQKLNNISISPLNDRFMIKDDKLLIGKSDTKSDNFDILHFASRNIEKIKIPSNIKIISSYAFDHCEKLSEIEFPNDSNLETIGKHAFQSSYIKQIYIPSSVTKIDEYAFYFCHSIKKIEIPTNSKLQTIGNSAFKNTYIKQLYIPESLIELKKGWCDSTKALTNIIVSPLNDRFMFKDDKYLVGKSDTKSDHFDILLFASKDITNIKIPSNIKIISSYAFHYCKNLSKVEIPNDSNLETISEYAFSDTNIEQIYIPSNVSTIDRCAFYSCDKLSKIEFPTNSKLQTIGKSAFEYTNISQIYIPSSVLTICACAFDNCNQLSKVEIPTNSKLQTIGNCAFGDTNIKQLYFPESLMELNEKWCCDANKLTNITISPLNDRFMFKENKYLVGKSDTKSDNFDILLFASRDITNIKIPSNIKIISSYAFRYCKNLSKVEIPNDSNLETIGEYAFSDTSIKQIDIPSKVINIKRKAFSFCDKLSRVEIPINSKMQIIEESLFEYANIKKIYIPSNVLMIRESSFGKCRKLSKVEIPTDSKLQTIEEFAFSHTNIRQIYIPSNVSNIDVGAFKFCDNLQIFEISEESKLEFLDKEIFETCKNVIIMIPPKLKKLINNNR